MEGTDKIICPDCDKETPKGETCTLCGFTLEGFSNFERWQNAIEKKKKKAEDERKKKEAEEARKKAAAAPPKKKSLFGHLGGK